MRPSCSWLWMSVLLIAGCPGEPAGPGPGDGGDGGTGVDAHPFVPPPSNWDRDLRSASLSFDIGAMTATATLTLEGDATDSVSLKIGDLAITEVRVNAETGEYEQRGDELAVRVNDDGAPVVIGVDYGFGAHTNFDGYLTTGATLTWPTLCGNLFPCRPDPADGATYQLEVHGLAPGVSAVYPARIDLEAPAYMVAFAVGDYAFSSLGTTTAGTEVGFHTRPGGEAAALTGTASLLGYLEFYETTYGAYPFGDRLAAVEVSWNTPVVGGIEHHPLYHVSVEGMPVPEVHAHEAAHGWFGNGVRIACWEDLVLSEGTTQYMAWRAIEEVDGLPAAEALRTTMQRRFAGIVATEDTEAYPDTCGEIDLLHHPLWSRVPYEKGAFFFDEVDDRIGRPTLDAALARFVADRAGGAAHMSDLIDTIEAESGQSIDDLVQRWLKSLGFPP